VPLVAREFTEELSYLFTYLAVGTGCRFRRISTIDNDDDEDALSEAETQSIY